MAYYTNKKEEKCLNKKSHAIFYKIPGVIALR